MFHMNTCPACAAAAVLTVKLILAVGDWFCVGNRNKKYLHVWLSSGKSHIHVTYIWLVCKDKCLLGNQTRSLLCTSLSICNVIRSTSSPGQHLTSRVSWKQQCPDPPEPKHCQTATGQAHKFHRWILTSTSVLQCQNKPQTPINKGYYTCLTTTKSKATVGLKWVNKTKWM